MTLATRKERTGATLKSIVRALHHRNFRLFFMGQSISLIGTWMQRIALGWLVYRLTGSAFLLGLVGFVGQIPGLLLAPFAGVIADRWNRHRLLVVTQALMMLQALVLSFLVLTNVIKIWEIVVLSVILGVLNVLDMPVRQAFVLEMIEDKKDLGNAIALNSSMVNGARLIGPSIAGLLIASAGEGVCFLINGISYLAVIASLLMMKIAKKELRARGAKVWRDLREGLKYAHQFEPIRAILMLLALVSLMGMPYAVLMPIFAKDILHSGPHGLGFLMGASGVGALTGALYLASRKTVLGLGCMIPIAVTCFGGGLILFSFSRELVLSLFLMLIVGFGQMIQLASSNTLLQTLVQDDKRGRVMSLYAMAFTGMMPVGSLMAGTVAGRIGAQWMVLIGGCICVVGALLFARRLPTLRAMARPVYVSMGILPEIAKGIQEASEPPTGDSYTQS
jgi:MFS family permease